MFVMVLVIVVKVNIANTRAEKNNLSNSFANITFRFCLLFAFKFEKQVRTKRTVLHNDRCAEKTNSGVDSKEIVCPWKNIAMVSNIVLMAAMKIADSKRTPHLFQIKTVRGSRGYLLATTLVSH